MVDVNDAKVVNHSFVITTKQLASILGWSCLIQGCVCWCDQLIPNGLSYDRHQIELFRYRGRREFIITSITLYFLNQIEIRFLFFSIRKDKIKTADIIAPLIRNVDTPRKWTKIRLLLIR